MRHHRVLLTAALTLAFVIAPASIGLADEPYPKNPVMGGTLVVGISSDPPQLNAAITTGSSEQEVGHAIFDSLIVATTDGGILPSLAESWEVAADSKTYTFKLRKDVKWHDGVAFTSADVKFTAEENWKKLHSRNRVALANLTSVDTPDANTAIFRFSQPYGALMVALGKYDGNIVPKHVFGDGKDLATHPRAKENLVGTGPFKLKEWVRGSHLTVTKNPDYWRKGQPYLDQIVFKIIPDGSTRGLALESGDIDLLGSSSLPALAQAERLKTVAGITVAGFDPKTAVSVGGAMLMFNLKHSIVGKLQVRQAIAHALDRKVIIDRVMLGNAYEMDGPVGGKWFTEGSATTYPHDIAKANTLLDQAGHPRAANGTRFKVRLSFDTTRTASPRIAEVMQEQLKAVGIDVERLGEERATQVDRQYKTFDYELGLPADFSGMGPDPATAISSRYATSAIGGGPYSNGAQYSNPAMDKALADSRTEADPAKRKALFAQVTKIATTDLPYIFFMQEKPRIIYRNTFTNFLWADERELDYSAIHKTPTGTSGTAGTPADSGVPTALIGGAVLVALGAGAFLLLRPRSRRT